jgi:DNA-binding transcriptional LysR family regulator
MSLENLHIRIFGYFLDIARGSSFFEAAQDHDITQSSFSKAIQRLEGELGVRLIDRSHYPVKLTEAGEQFNTDLLELIPIYHKLKLHMLSYSQNRQIRCRIVPAMTNFRIQQILDEFTKVYPDIPVYLTDGEDPQEAIKALHQGEADFCIIHKPFSPATLLRMIILTSDRLFVMLPKTHHLASHETISLPDLNDETFVTSRFSYTILRDICSKIEFSQLNIRQNVPRPTIVSTVEAGKGVALYYESGLTLFHLENIALRPMMEIPNNPVTLVSSSRNELTKEQKIFSDFLVSTFRKRKKV